MRNVLTWLLFFGMIAGLQLRVLGADPCESVAAAHSMMHAGHHHDPGKPCDPSHEKHCPLEHENAACSHVMPLADLTDLEKGAPMFHVTHSPIAREICRAPDEPVAELDKPPLI